MSARSELINIPEEYLTKAEEIAEANYGFTSDLRVLMLIQRHSDGGHTNNSKVRSYISDGAEQWVSCLAKLLHEKDQYTEIPLRIYQTLNARDIEKGIRMFKFLQLEADYYDSGSRHWFYNDIKNRWVSAIMRPNCKVKGSLFLIDCDSPDKLEWILVEQKLKELTTLVHGYQSKNGYHFIVEPFNPVLFEHAQCEIKKDAMMLLNF